MKLKPLFAYLGVLLLMYLSVSFVNTDLIPSKWSREERMFFVLFGNFFALVASGYYAIFKD